MAHSHYSLHKRYTKSGKTIFYVQFYCPDGTRLTARSSGQSSKAAAKNWADEQWKRGNIYSHKDITLEQFIDRRHFWIWGECEYIKGKLARGRGKIGPGYTDAMRTYTVRHVLPELGKIRLRKLTEKTIDTWLLNLPEKAGRNGKPLSHSTANHCLKSLRIILNEAVREELIPFNPAAKVDALEDVAPDRALFTVRELKELFNPENFNEIWLGDPRQYTINFLAFSTGVRMGEARGLLKEKVHNDHILIHHKWTDKYGLGDPKTGSARPIMITKKTSEYLHNLMKISPYQDPKDFVFWADRSRDKPMSGEVIRKRLYYALNCIGITKEDRDTRGLDFHAWRHVFNSLHRGRIPDYKLMRITGHKTQQMTERYTSLSQSDYQDVLQIQEQVQEEFFGSGGRS